MKQQGSGGTAQRRARAGPRASARRTLRLGAAALVVLLLAAGAAGQPQPLSKERGLRDVRALLRAGGHQAAIALLEKLDAAYPNDSAIVEGLFQALVTVKAYQRAEEVMARFTRARPDDPRGPANLALVYLLMERRADALAALEKLIALKPAEAWPYQTAYQVLWERGAPADATAMILRARAAVGDSALFALDAAQIYRSQAKLDSAAVEYVRAGAAGEDPGLAVDGVISMAEDPEDRRAVVASLERAALLPEAEEVARTCLWQLRLLDGDCAGAFGEVSALARRGRLSTGVLELFAARSKDLACYAECSEAYQLALGLSENKAQYPMLLLNKAGCEVAGGLADQAALTYGKVLEVHPNTKWACDAELALGTLARDRGLLDQAAGHADRVIASRAAGDRKFDAILFKGDCLTRGGNLDEAFKTYDQVGTDWRPDHAQEAFYNLGEIKFYQGGFDEAVSYYNVALRQYPEEPRANDSVERLLLVKAVKGDLGKTWLADFSRAALLERQGKTDEAVVLLKQLAADPGQGVIKTESLRRLAAIFAQRGEFDRAIRLYTQLGDTLVTAVSPNSLEAVGDIYAGLGRTPEAIAAYEQVIVKFPESVSAGEARRKIEVAKRKPE
jgi:tetratricopeptide (TPR) repeat protein